MGKEQFSSNVVVANEYTLLGSPSIYGSIPLVANTATEIKVGASRLIGRTTLFIQNHPNNDLLFIGLDNTVSTAKFGLVLASGQGVQLKLSSTDPISIYAISPSVGNVGVIEGAI